MAKIYNSFDEIEHDLKVLRLETKINKEKMKRDVHEIKEELAPLNLLSNLASSIITKAFIYKTVNKIIGKK